MEEYRKAAWLYMELAEQGFGVAALNLALLLEREPVFDKGTYLSEKGVETFGNGFELSKQLALKYLQLGLLNREVDDESSLKIADFLYAGTSGAYDMTKAKSVFSHVESLSSAPEVRGHALLKLGMIYQFGDAIDDKVKVDFDMAQQYYDKALNEKTADKAPVYLISLYNRWQSLNVTNTFWGFAAETREDPWSNGGPIFLGIVFYVIVFWSTIRYLRKDIHDDK